MRTRAKMKFVASDRARREISANAEIFVLPSVEGEPSRFGTIFKKLLKLIFNSLRLITGRPNNIGGSFDEESFRYLFK